MKVSLWDKKGKKTSDSIELNDSVWKILMNEDLVVQVVNVYCDNQRKGTAHSKTRAEVRGGGAKPWRQKGTGRARHGSRRSPIWVKGGVAFGPRSYKKFKSIPKKMNRLALKCVLSNKVSSDNLFVIESEPVLKAPSTREMLKIIENLGIDKGKTLLVIPVKSKVSDVILMSVKNLDNVLVKKVPGVNVYDVVNAQNLVVVKDSVNEFEKRLV